MIEVAEGFADTCWDELEGDEGSNNSETDTDEEYQVFEHDAMYTW